MYVVVNFLSQVIFVFLCFWVIYIFVGGEVTGHRKQGR